MYIPTVVIFSVTMFKLVAASVNHTYGNDSFSLFMAQKDNNVTGTITSGRLSYGVPAAVLVQYGSANLSMFNGGELNRYEVDHDGVTALAELLVSQRITDDEHNVMKRDTAVETLRADILQALDQAYGESTVNHLVKRTDCNGGYWHNFTNTLHNILQTVHLTLRSHWKEYSWTLATSFVGDLSGWVSLGLETAHGAKARSLKHNCNGGFDWINWKDSSGKTFTYWVGYAPWTSGANCDTQAPEDVLAYVLELAYKEVNNAKGAAWCFSATNEGTWHVDIRIMRWEEGNFCGLSGWDIPCESFKFVPNSSNNDEL
ncbi:hypothetical protein KAFR_0E03080 [Kazachstania africana CBS 2517]|uniref:Uncharacterized protein n=1 Tax=Kazachstania africana (strain ATCC 22294 / BCRC 22015 / CBS 2517 / CECT 1963 / NBRC 1671 / NRRL Y-8276) TaxID=1071382 RepID=H2AVR0_KAZAF|nr:hypothetical protein KAFR_0E03080 [Kazachstania africana CBS 2517]CCF58460.1 hypothetical protein KAFR_0E03080 [Kazachstania africana CBS 2517]